MIMLQADGAFSHMIDTFPIPFQKKDMKVKIHSGTKKHYYRESNFTRKYLD